MQRAGWTFVVATMMVLLRPAAAQRGPAAPGGGQAPAVAQAGEGGALYGRFCSPCHGAAGDGHGPARPWLAPLPRDLIRGPFKWRAAAGDILPDRADLRAAIEHGVPGTSMPGFADAMRRPPTCLRRCEIAVTWAKQAASANCLIAARDR